MKLPPRPSSNRLITRRKSDLEISRLVESMQAGNLTDRAQLDGFEGLDREMLVEVNSLLDALITPLTIASDRLRRLAKGEIPPKISESFSGDLDRMKADINACIDQLSTQSVG